MGDIVPFALAAAAHDARPDGGHGPFAPAADAHDAPWGILFLLPWQLLLMMRGLMGDIVPLLGAADAHDARWGHCPLSGAANANDAWADEDTVPFVCS